MRIEIIAKNYKVTDHLKEIIEKKMEKFSRYFEEDTVAKFTLKQNTKEQYAMEITVYLNGSIIRSEVMSDNMYTNIDIALPKIEGQIRKYRTKLDRIKKTAFDEVGIYGNEQPQEKALVRTKSFELKKISVQEAIDEMELVDHDFFAFVNDKNGMVNIVYRRTDNNVGLIDLIY